MNWGILRKPMILKRSDRMPITERVLTGMEGGGEKRLMEMELK